jgi:preprotein translocase subunit SecE
MIKKIRDAWSNSFDELTNKVSWPTWPELLESTWITIVATFIFALIILVMDKALGFTVGYYLTNFRF